ncbi:MAG: D-alanyl-D-alanine carboxypeptidase/D-alanyl-D-alanine-endopeptidase [Nitrospinota bacterium]
MIRPSATRTGAWLLLGVLAPLLAAGPAGAASPPGKVPPARGQEAERGVGSVQELAALLRQGVSQHCPHPDRVSVTVRSLASGETLFAHHPDAQRIPASNIKLATTAAALAVLGPDYTFPTDVYAEDPIRGGTLEGNLYLKGYGDPSLVQERLRELARELRLLGLRRVKGALVADDTYFDAERYGQGWHAEGSLRPYLAPHGALSLNFNVVWVMIDPGPEPGAPARVVLEPETDTVRLEGSVETGPPGGRPQVRLSRRRVEGRDRVRAGGAIPARSKRVTSPVTVSEPALFAAGGFAAFLKEQGVEIGGGIRKGATPEEAELLARTLSRPLGELVRDVNKISNNFMAEQVLKTLGAELHGLPGTAEKGLRVVRGFLVSAGVPADSFTLADGSGLSRLNRISAAGLAALLAAVHRDFRLRPEFMASLAVVGIDGTARRRIHRASTVRRVRVKSGLLDGVNALSGYGVAENGEELAFAILSNGNGCHPIQLFRDLTSTMTLLERPLPPALSQQSEEVRRGLARPMPDPRERDRWRAQGRPRVGPAAPPAADPGAAEAVSEVPSAAEPAPTGLEFAEPPAAPGGERGSRP